VPRLVSIVANFVIGLVKVMVSLRVEFNGTEAQKRNDGAEHDQDAAVWVEPFPEPPTVRRGAAEGDASALAMN
jgi:hypothetical protein